MTNREWLESLSTEDMAAFFTTGLLTTIKEEAYQSEFQPRYIELGIDAPQTPLYRNLYSLVHNIGYSIKRVSLWLNSPQTYEVAELPKGTNISLENDE